jgi:hypothetical protein
MRLVLAFTEAHIDKRQHTEDDKSNLLGSSDSPMLPDRVSNAKLPPLSQADYPLVKFWERKVWKSVAVTRKDTSEVESKGSSRGGTRSSKGENVMMLYIEDTNGLPIDGSLASGMRDFARCIWRSLYERGIAPETWGKATKEVREEFCREMESEFFVLRLCDNHWKANALATTVYSQWYRTYDKKVKTHLDNDSSNEGNDGDGNDSGDDTSRRSDGPPKKRARTTIALDNDSDVTVPLPEPEISVYNKGPFIHAIIADTNYTTETPCSESDVRRAEDNGSSGQYSAMLDPLYVVCFCISVPLTAEISRSNVFNQPASQFQVLETVPDIIQQPRLTLDQDNANQITDTAAPVAQTNAPSSEVSNVNVPLQTASGSATTSAPTPADVPLTGDPTPTPPHTTDASASDPNGTATEPNIHDPIKKKSMYQKRYQYKTKMHVGIGISAR